MYHPRYDALLKPIWDLGEGGGTGLIKPEYRTVIAIGLEDFAKVSCGKGDEVIVALSDGTTMTGAEFINAAMEGALGDISEERRVGKEGRSRSGTKAA